MLLERRLWRQKSFCSSLQGAGSDALWSSGVTGFRTCYQEMLKVVKGVIKQPHELKDSATFYAFSYYFDHAVEAGLIGKTKTPNDVRNQNVPKRGTENPSPDLVFWVRNEPPLKKCPLVMCVITKYYYFFLDQIDYRPHWSEFLVFNKLFHSKTEMDKLTINLIQREIEPLCWPEPYKTILYSTRGTWTSTVSDFCLFLVTQMKPEEEPWRSETSGKEQKRVSFTLDLHLHDRYQICTIK